MKISIIGAGNVGASAAKCLAVYELASEIVLFDVVAGLPQGKALDMAQGLAAVGNDTVVVGTNDYGPTALSDIVVVTAGLPRKPGMSREDLLTANAAIVSPIAERALAASPDAIFIVVTNPLDAMAQLLWRRTGLDKRRVMGMAGALDNARFRYFLAKRLGVAVSDVHALVLGSHGESMVPILSLTTVSGAPVETMLMPEALAAVVARARDGGAEIVELLKTGSAYYAPAEAIAKMVSAIVKDKNETIACSALCEGEYDIRGSFIGVPVRLNRSGASRVLELPLERTELESLRVSAGKVREQCEILGV